jgi:hypothetical protein
MEKNSMKSHRPIDLSEPLEIETFPTTPEVRYDDAATSYVTAANGITCFHTNCGIEVCNPWTQVCF